MYTCFGPGALGIDLAFPEAAALAASCGFEGIQVDLGYLREHGAAEYRGILEEYGLATGSAGLPVAVDGDDERYEADLDALPETAERLADAGCTRCSTYIMSFSDERPYEENFAFFRERLEAPAAILAEHGIRLGLEFLGPQTLRAGHEYEFVHDSEGMLELCSAIGTGNVGLLLDSWHWHTAGGSVAALESLDDEDVVDVHVNDAPSGVPLDEQVDSVRRMPGETGEIDIETFLGHLDDIGYDGPVMVEPFSDDLEAMEPRPAAERTMESLETIWERAGL
jgi:sugar phosphate isomerase/epimerase